MTNQVKGGAVVTPFQVQRWCTWSGIAAVVVFFVGFIVADFIPPPSPSLTLDQVVAHYRDHAGGIRVGMVITMISGMFFLPMVGVISAQLRRIPRISSALTYAQIAAGTAGSLFFFLAPILFLVAVYRPERPAELTYLMNDFAWIMAVLPWPPAFMQCVIIAVAILSDTSPTPIFPRWVSFFNCWVAVGFLPGSLLPFFKSGPFAWNGIFVFWLAGSVFGLWFIVMTVMLLNAIATEERNFVQSDELMQGVSR